MVHCFEVEDAQAFGLNAAVILYNLKYWIAKNRANGSHRHDGRTWTYNSVRAFASLFPYLTERQIRTALELLKDKGVILQGNYNKSGYDRTAWYAIVEEETLFAHIPIPAGGDDPTASGIIDGLKGGRGRRIKIGKSYYTVVNRWEWIENIRKTYPELTAPPAARKAIDQALERIKETRHLEEYEAYCYLIGRTRAYAEIRGQKLDYLKHASTWFNNDCFEEGEQVWSREVGKKFRPINDETEKGFFG